MLTGLSTSAALSVHASESGSAEPGPWKIVNYWSVTCAPCRLEIPELNLLNESLSSDDVIVLGVNFDEHEPAKTRQIARRMGIEFTTLEQAEVEALHLVAPFVLPTTYILSPDNKVMARLVGAQDRESLTAKLIELAEFNQIDFIIQ